MGKWFSKKKENDKALSDARALSQQTNSKINNFQNELTSANQTAQTDTPNIFTRFVNWFKGAFSSKNEPNVEQGTTFQNNMSAESRQGVNNTLPPEVTGTGVTSQSFAANSTPEADIDTQTENTNEAPEVIPETPPEYEQREESEVKEAPDKLTIGNMEFNTYEEDGLLFSKSGTMSVLGKRTEWSTPDRIHLAKDGNSKYFGSGRICFKNDRIMCGNNSAVVIEANRLSYFFDQLVYFQNDIYIDLGRDIENLDSISGKKMTLLKKPSEEAAAGDGSQSAEKSDNAGAAQAPAGGVRAEFKGDFTADSSGFKGVWIPADYPGYLFDKTVIPKIKLSTENENGLGFSLVPPDARVSFGIDNIAKLTGAEPIGVSVAENGDIVYKITEKYNVDLLSGLYTSEIDLPAAEIEKDEIIINKIEFEEGDIGVSGGEFKLSAKDGVNSGRVSIDKLTYKDLTITKIDGTIDNNGISAGAESYSFTIGGKKLSGTLEGFSWNPGEKVFSVEKFSIGSDEIKISDEITLNNSNLNFSLVKGKFSFEAGGAFVVDNYQKGWIGVSTEGVDFKVAWDEKSGFSTTIGGSIKVTVGKDGDDIASAEASKFSYENGTFKVDSLSLSTTFDKLVSQGFSGSAVMTASDLTISTKEKKGFELASMNVDISDLAYNDKTLVKSASLAVLFKKDDPETTADTEKELALGNTPGALTEGKIAIYLLEDKKGVKLSAKSFGTELGGVKIGITDFEAEFFGSGGDNNAKGSIQIDAGDNICGLLGVNGLSFSASDFSVGTGGLKVSSVSGSLAGATIANSLMFESLDVSMSFDKDMKFGTLTAGGSAKLGKIGLTKAQIIVKNNENKYTANITAEKITYGDILEISGVSGSFGKDSVEVESADVALKIADTGVSGSVRNLSWSRESNFSVEQISVAAGDFKVFEGFEIKDASVKASLKNNSFGLELGAAMVLKDFKRGIITINDKELKLSVSLKKDKGEGEEAASKFKLGGSVMGTLGVVFGDNIAYSEISDIKYDDGKFSVGKFDADVDLGKLGSQSLNGEAALSIEKFSFDKEKKFSVEKIGITASNVSYMEIKLFDSLSLDAAFTEDYELGNISAKVDKIGFGSFKITNATLALEFEKAMKLKKGKFDGGFDYDKGNDISVSGGTANISAQNEKMSGGVTIGKLTYKSLNINNLVGTIDENGISAGAKSFDLSIGGRQFSGSIEGFSWDPNSNAFSVKKFNIGADKLSFGDNIAIDNSNLRFSLDEGKYSFEAGGTLVLRDFHKGWVGVSTEGVNFEVVLGDESGFSTTIGGSIKVTIGKDGSEIASAEASDFSYEDGTFKVNTLTLSTTFDKLVSEKFSGSAVMTASGLTITTKEQDDFELGSMTVNIKELAYNSKTLVQNASVALIFKDGDSEEPTAQTGEELDLGNASGALSGGKIAIYLLENKKGAKLSAESFNATIGGAQFSITDFEAEFFGSTGDNKAKGNFKIEAGEKVRDFLGIGKIDLSASDFSIGSNGIRVGTVSGSLAGAKLSNSLEFEKLDVTMSFDKDMKFSSLTAGGSAKLGKIGLSDVQVDVSNEDDKFSAKISAQKITYGDDLLEITGVEGRFSKESVEIASAAIAVNAANTKMSGSLTKLSWSSESNFSVEKLSVAADNTKIAEGFNVKDTMITASLKNNSFDLNVGAALVVKNLKRGIIKINDTELKLSLSLRKGKGEGEDADSAYKFAGSVEGSLGVVIGGDIASATIGDIKYDNGEFSVEKFDADADLGKLGSGSLSGKAALSAEKLRIGNGTFSVGGVKLNASDVAYKGKSLLDSLEIDVNFDDNYNLQKIDTKIGKEINIGGFVIKETGIVVEFDEGMKIKAAELSGKLGYKNYFSGEGSVTFGKDNFSIGKLQNVIMSYGCFSGGLTGIETSGDNVTFTGLSLEKKSDDKADFGGDTKSLTAKALRAIPNIGIALAKLEFKDGKLQKPSFDDISIKSFSATPFDIGNLLKATISYDGEKGEFTVSINSKFALPKSGDEPQELKLFELPFPILPLLQAKVNLSLKAKLSTDLNIKATIAKNKDTLDFTGGVNVKANAIFGIFGGIDLSLGAVFAEVSAGLQVGLDLDTEADLSGQLGFSYDSKEESLLDSFKLNKESTNFNYDLISDLSFKVNLKASARAGLPIIFDKGNKTLTHSWNLFNYNLMKAKIHGSIAYDKDKQKFVFENNAKLSGPDNAFGRYSPEKTEDKINDFGEKLETLKKNVELINSLLEKSKGSTEVYGGLGEMIDKEKVGGLKDIRSRIDDTFDNGKANALACHEEFVKMNSMIKGVSGKMAVNEANFEKVNALVKDSQTALNIIGYGADSDKTGGMTREKYLQFIEGLKQLLNDEDRLKELAKLDPNAVQYMLGVFELDSLEKVVAEKIEKREEKAGNGMSPTAINPRIYKAAMEDVEGIIKDREKTETALKKRLENAKKAVENAAKKKQEWVEFLADKDVELGKLNDIVEKHWDEEYRKKGFEESVKWDFMRDLTHADNAVYEAKSKVTKIEESIAKAKAKGKDTSRNEVALQTAKENQKKMEKRLQDKEDEKQKALQQMIQNFRDAKEAHFKRVDEALKMNDTAELESIQNNLVDYLFEKIDDRYKYKHQKEERQWYLDIIAKYEKQEEVAQAKVEEIQSKLQIIKIQNKDSADIATAIVGFQEFVDQEHNASKRAVQKQFDDHGVDKNKPVPKVIATSARVASVKKMIQKLISDSEDEYKLKKGFGKNNSGDSELKDYNERIAAVRGGTDLYRTKLDGYGLKGNSTTSFQAMRENRDKFNKMLGQRDKIYEQLSEFHGVIKTALDSWNKVHGFSFAKEGGNDSVARVKDGFSQITDLIGKTDDAVKTGAKLSETSGGVKQELVRLGITEEITTIEAVEKEIKEAEKKQH